MMLKSISTLLAWIASMKLGTIIKENNVEQLDNYRKMQHKYIIIFIFPLWDLAWDTCKHLPGLVGGVYLKGKRCKCPHLTSKSRYTHRNRTVPTYLCLVGHTLISCLLIPISVVYFSIFSEPKFSIRNELLAVIMLFITMFLHIWFITLLSVMKGCKYSKMNAAMFFMNITVHLKIPFP